MTNSKHGPHGSSTTDKNSTYFQTVHFLCMHYSAASINQEDIQVSFFIYFLSNKNTCEGRYRNYTVLCMEMWWQVHLGNVLIERESRDKVHSTPDRFLFFFFFSFFFPFFVIFCFLYSSLDSSRLHPRDGSASTLKNQEQSNYQHLQKPGP